LGPVGSVGSCDFEIVQKPRRPEALVAVLTKPLTRTAHIAYGERQSSMTSIRMRAFDTPAPEL